MAARSISPGGALLRSSRMFSMPAPIAGSPTDYAAATKHYSPTATAPFPTHLTITTPSTSRVRGDWGLKRPLPLKTTTKQTFPLVRVRQMDSIEHITDFQSASDHTMTLKKFQELNMPITVPGSTWRETQLLSSAPQSVFEKETDVTDIEPGQAQAIENRRWNFKGPWLAGMTDGQFDRYLAKNVRPRRAEFQAFLKKVCAEELTQEQVSHAMQHNLPEPPTVDASGITDAKFMDYLRDLRRDRLFLLRQVSRFLDLAPVNVEKRYIDTMKPGRSQDFNRENPYGEHGPPITHPSAGLSYLRTPHFLDNHPVYGPLKYHPSVKARVLKPRNVATGVHQPVVAVAGFITERPYDTKALMRASPQMSARTKALTQLDLESPGGAKLYVKVDYATVDSKGKICVGVSDPNPESELVTKELLGENNPKDNVYERAINGEYPADMSEMSYRFSFRSSWSRGGGGGRVLYSSQESYGLGPNRG